MNPADSSAGSTKATSTETDALLSTVIRYGIARRAGDMQVAEKLYREIEAALRTPNEAPANDRVTAAPDGAVASPAQEPVAMVSAEPCALPFRKVALLGKDLPVGTQLYTAPQRYVSVPPGWKLVPLQPTEPMIEAGVKDSRPYISFVDAEDVYRVMLAAAPEAPKQDVSRPSQERLLEWRGTLKDIACFHDKCEEIDRFFAQFLSEETK
jgi:hypothetical protein